MNQEFIQASAKVFRQTIMIIDALTQRGAFKGEELSTIGNLRDVCNQLTQATDEYEAHVAAQQSSATETDDTETELELDETVTKGNTTESVLG